MTSQDSSGFLFSDFFANVSCNLLRFSFFPAIMQIGGFEYFQHNCPTILIEILEYVARVSEHSVIQ